MASWSTSPRTSSPTSTTRRSSTSASSRRAVCARGLASAPGTITWIVPQLRIMTPGNLAVAYGLNRMTAEQADGETIENWSRGT